MAVSKLRTNVDLFILLWGVIFDIKPIKLRLNYLEKLDLMHFTFFPLQIRGRRGKFLA